MNISRVSVLCIALISVSLVSFSCRKSEESPEASREAPTQISQAGDRAAASGEKEYDADERRKDEPGAPAKAGKEGGLEGHFLMPMDLARERLLEYHVNLSYECDNILYSRKTLLGLIAKHGFIKTSSATTETRTPFLNVEFYVKADRLYDALRELESLGVLENENISVIDHTENMVMSERKIRRENIRIFRRNKAMGQVTAVAKNWEAVENSIEQSEERLDQSEHGKWQIRDKVAWAKVVAYLHGPEQPNRISVPLYRNAFIGLVNFTLNLVYVLIWLFPFIALGIVIWVKRGKIKGFFSRKK